MNDLLHIALLVSGVLGAMSALLYVLTTIDPQTQRPQPTSANVPA